MPNEERKMQNGALEHRVPRVAPRRRAAVPLFEKKGRARKRDLMDHSCVR
jgi:hypothetical protein